MGVAIHFSAQYAFTLEGRTVLDRAGTVAVTVLFWNRSKGKGSVHTAL